MSEQKIDALLKATLFNDAIYSVDQTDDAGTLAHPWAGAPIAKGGQQFDDGASNIPDVVSRLFEKAEKGLLVKSTGLAYESWDTVLTKTTVETDPAVAALPARSRARLQKVYDAIDRTFAGHVELGENAKAVARRMLADTRAGVIFDAA
jgi:hypothetical protein